MGTFDTGFFELARDAGFFGSAVDAGFADAARDAGLADAARDAGLATALLSGFTALLAGLVALEAGLVAALLAGFVCDDPKGRSSAHDSAAQSPDRIHAYLLRGGLSTLSSGFLVGLALRAARLGLNSLGHSAISSSSGLALGGRLLLLRTRLRRRFLFLGYRSLNLGLVLDAARAARLGSVNTFGGGSSSSFAGHRGSVRVMGF